MYVEQNAAGGDTEVVIAGTAGDDGLRRLQVKWPDREVMVTLLADRTTLGMRTVAKNGNIVAAESTFTTAE